MEISRQAATRLEMWASDGGCGHEATAVHDAAWRRGGDVGHRARGISHEQDTARHGRTRRGEIQLRQRRGLLGRVSPACSVSFDQAGLHECSPSTSTRNALRSGLPKFRHAGSSARLRTSDTVLRAAFPVVKARISSGKVGHPGALREIRQHLRCGPQRHRDNECPARHGVRWHGRLDGLAPVDHSERRELGSERGDKRAGQHWRGSTSAGPPVSTSQESMIPLAAFTPLQLG
jgi:hypothetical protein